MSARRPSSDRGAVLAESAMAVPVMLALPLVVFDVGQPIVGHVAQLWDGRPSETRVSR